MTQRNILFCGDTFLKARDGGMPLAQMGLAFRDAIVCLNLEASLSGSYEKEKNVVLSIDEKALNGLPDEVKLLVIVNNHSADCGNPQRLADALIKRGKAVVGPDNPSMVNLTVNGISVDFLAAYFALPRIRVSYDGQLADKLLSMLHDSSAKRKIVNLHWGYEHTDVPAPFQRQLAYRLIDAGADLIIGHHPHVPQGCEVYKNKQIYYSIGNYNFWQFDGETSNSNRWGYMVRYEPDNNKVEAIPYSIDENYQPCPVSSENKDRLLLRIQELSILIKTADIRAWLEKEYAGWYRHEINVWVQHLLKCRSLYLYLKWIAWLFTPMQLTYYGHSARAWLEGYIERP
jgi:hypothetical protein